MLGGGGGGAAGDEQDALSWLAQEHALVDSECHPPAVSAIHVRSAFSLAILIAVAGSRAIFASVANAPAMRVLTIVCACVQSSDDAPIHARYSSMPLRLRSPDVEADKPQALGTIHLSANF